MNKVSPTQISAFLACPSAWYRGWILKERAPPTRSQELGTAIHAQLEAIAKGETFAPRDLFPIVACLVHDTTFKPLLDFEDEATVWIERQAKTLRFVDGRVAMNGKIDVLKYTGGPELLVQDWKTCSSLNFIKSPEMLSKDVQAITYANDSLLFLNRPEIERVRFRHVYLPTRGGTPVPVETVMDLDYLGKELERIDGIVRQMYELATGTPVDEVDNVERNLGSCDDYGGCFHRPKCLAAQTPVSFSPANMANLFSGQSGRKPKVEMAIVNLPSRAPAAPAPAAAAAAPTVAPAAASKFAVRPAKPAPVDHGPAILAHIGAVLDTAATAVLERADDEAALSELISPWPDEFWGILFAQDEEGNLIQQDLEAAAQELYAENTEHFVDLAQRGQLSTWPEFLTVDEPQEQAAPAAPAAAPAAEAPRKRGRPPGSKNAPKPGAQAAQAAPTPAPKPAPTPAPKPAAAPVAVTPRPAAAPAQTRTPVTSTPSRLPFTLYIDCAPSQGGTSVFAILKAIMPAADLNSVYTAEYSTGIRALSAAFATPSDELVQALVAAEHVTLCSRDIIGSAVREALLFLADRVVTPV